jgi:hypothetical protein
MIFKNALATSNSDLVFKGSTHTNLEKVSSATRIKINPLLIFLNLLKSFVFVFRVFVLKV